MSKTLIDLLTHHHIVALETDYLLPTAEPKYIGSDLHKATAAAIAEAKADPLRTRVPVWRCPVCKLKFYSRSEYDAHKADEAYSAAR